MGDKKSISGTGNRKLIQHNMRNVDGHVNYDISANHAGRMSSMNKKNGIDPEEVEKEFKPHNSPQLAAGFPFRKV